MVHSATEKSGVLLNPDEVSFEAIRASGPGGQNVNKVSTALHCRFNIQASSLPERIKQRLIESKDRRITDDAVIVIKAQRYRSQDKNRRDALERLQQMIDQAARISPKRVATRPSRTARKKRMEDKSRRGQVKNLRSRRRIDVD